MRGRTGAGDLAVLQAGGGGERSAESGGDYHEGSAGDSDDAACGQFKADSLGMLLRVRSRSGSSTITC